MPISHDGKPRNKDRRQKYQKEMAKTNLLRKLITKRQVQKVLLRQAYLDAVKAQREFELSLRTAGIKWRAAERAVATLAKGKWTTIDGKMIEKLFSDHGMKVAA